MTDIELTEDALKLFDSDYSPLQFILRPDAKIKLLEAGEKDGS